MSESKQPSIHDIIGEPEELCEELAEFVIEMDGIGGEILNAPLIQCPFYHEAMNGMLNRSFAIKREATEKAWDEEDWSHFVFMHERPWRWDALKTIFDEHYEGDADSKFWSCFGSVWTDSENWWQAPYCHWIQEWTEWSNIYDVRKGLMEDNISGDWEKDWEEIPMSLDVKRGWSRQGGFDGYSWTTDDAISNKFASRLASIQGHPWVAHGTIRKERLLAMITSREESEYFIHTENVDVKFVENIDADWHDNVETVSFDFDGLLHEIEGDNDPKWFMNNHELLTPIDENIAMAKDIIAAGANVAIITARPWNLMKSVFDFLDAHEISVGRVYATDNGFKRPLLDELGVVSHFDDREPEKGTEDRWKVKRK